MRLIIDGRLPNMNDLTEKSRGNKYSANHQKHKAEERVMWAAKQYLRGWKARGPVYMRYTWYEPNRRRDKSNICAGGRKIIEDALVKGGYLHNDGWNEIAGFSDDFKVDKARPRIEIEIEEVYEET